MVKLIQQALERVRDRLDVLDQSAEQCRTALRSELDTVLAEIAGTSPAGEVIDRGQVLDLAFRYCLLQEEYSGFVHGVSHHLKSPLSALIGYSTLLLDGGRSPEETSRYLQRIVDNSCLLDRMIDDLLYLSRLTPDTSAPCSLDHAAREALVSLKQSIEEKNLSVWIQPGMPPVHMSEEHLVRLMYHLLSNAVRYSPQRGRIAVGRIEGEFYVSDLGPGMSSDTRARAFTIFFTTMKKAKEHTGAGLFIARKIAGVYGGSMRIESSNDSGTSVLFTLGPQFPGT